MLRNPVDVMYSQHSQLVFNQREDLTDFGAALAAEPDRLAGQRVPADAIRPEALYYRKSVRFPEQVRRYLDVFGRDASTSSFSTIWLPIRARFTAPRSSSSGVDPAVEIDPSVYNPNRPPRSGSSQRLIFAPRGRRCAACSAGCAACR